MPMLLSSMKLQFWLPYTCNIYRWYYYVMYLLCIKVHNTFRGYNDSRIPGSPYTQNDRYPQGNATIQDLQFYNFITSKF